MGLLDSGAEHIIFPSSVAEAFSIPYTKGERKLMTMADGKTTYFHSLPFEKHGTTIFFEDKAMKNDLYFFEGDGHILLGQDFFKHFRITFDRAIKIFEIDPK